MAIAETPPATLPAPVETADTTEPAPTHALLALGADELVEQDLLVEDVSIDGMCGVY